LQRREQVVVVGVQRRDDLGGRVARELGQQFHAVAVGQLQVDQDELERVGRGLDLLLVRQADVAARALQVARLGDGDRVA